MRALTSVLAAGAILALVSVVSAGSVTFYGDVIFTEDAITHIDVAGYTSDTEYDVIEVIGGSVSLDGTLEVELLDGFQPVLDSTFDFLRHDSGVRTGEFAVFNSPTWGDGLYFDIVYGDTAVTLQTTPEPATLSLMTLGGLALLRRRRRGMCK